MAKYEHKIDEYGRMKCVEKYYLLEIELLFVLQDEKFQSHECPDHRWQS